MVISLLCHPIISQNTFFVDIVGMSYILQTNVKKMDEPQLKNCYQTVFSEKSLCILSQLQKINTESIYSEPFLQCNRRPCIDGEFNTDIHTVLILCRQGEQVKTSKIKYFLQGIKARSKTKKKFYFQSQKRNYLDTVILDFTFQNYGTMKFYYLSYFV